ncbi:hypothetical protein KAR91_32565 [Candidatus Pacearchaeota archaeon]|nr:hypothetical protein [Candidatus Pacearchaeota archaeon]
MALDKKKIQRMTEEAAQRSGLFRYLKKNTTTSLRVMEYKDKDGSIVFAQELVEHRPEGGGGGKAIGICRRETFGKPCAFCRANALSESGILFKSSTRYVMNALDINNEPEKVSLWVLPTTVFGDIADYALDDEWADLLEAKNGHGISIEKKGAGMDTRYTTRIMRNAFPVGKSVISQVVDPLDSIRDPGLESQCITLNRDVSELFNEDELKKFKADDSASGGKSTKSSKASGDKTSKKSKKKTDEKGSGFEIGQTVKYQEEEEPCTIIKIDGDDITIEDASGDEYSATPDDLTACETEDPDDGFTEGDEVRFQEEEETCTITGIVSDTEVTITDADGSDFDVKIDELTKVEGSGKTSKKDGKKPNCYGKADLYGDSDPECKECIHQDACSGEIELNEAGVGKTGTKGKGKKDTDDVVDSIMGS